MSQMDQTTGAKRRRRRAASPIELLGGFLFAYAERKEQNTPRRLDTVALDDRGSLKRFLQTLMFAILAGVAIWLLATALWEQSNWSNLKMDEIVYELNTSLKGTGNHMIRTYLLSCVLPGAAGAVIAAVVAGRIRNGMTWNAVTFRGGAICFLICAGLLTYAFVKLDVGPYMMNRTHESNYIEKNFADPEDTVLTFPEQKRNLIYIYLESMESTFSDVGHGGAFAEDYIPELTQLASENVNFTGANEDEVNGGYAPAGATWTAGAMFAQSSGLPLKIPIEGNDMASQVTFFPKVQTMGDILEKEGYRQALLIGSDATFGGRRLLYTEHGHYEIWDHPYAQRAGWIPEDYSVWWGYEDEKLFQFAKDQLNVLAAGEEPFNLTMLTVDTHFPDGYVCRLCQDHFKKNQYANVLACSSRQVSDFVRWVQEQPFYENTTIVLMGDHPTMDADFCDDIDSEYARKTYVTIINPADTVSDPGVHRDYTTFDLFPTTLSALGVQIEGNRLGLGVDLFSGEQTLLERDGLVEMNKELKYHSDFIDSISGFSDTVNAMKGRLPTLNTEVTMKKSAGKLSFTFHNLDRIETDFTSLEVDAYGRDGEERTGLWSLQAEETGEGEYTVTVPKEQFQDFNIFTLELFVTIENARLQVDQTYEGNIRTGLIAWEPDD